jgi:hypothetical protein
MGNLALNKPVKASALYRPGSKGTMANDGDVTDPITHYASNVKDPFWRVDLLDFYLITTVEIITRIDGYFHTNDVTEVRVGKSGCRNVGLRYSQNSIFLKQRQLKHRRISSFCSVGGGGGGGGGKNWGGGGGGGGVSKIR